MGSTMSNSIQSLTDEANRDFMDKDHVLVVMTEGYLPLMPQGVARHHDPGEGHRVTHLGQRHRRGVVCLAPQGRPS